MTQLTKPVRRETATFYRGRALVLAICPRFLTLHEKGRRDKLVVEYATVFEFAMKLRWRQEQAEKQAARKQKRGER